MAQFHVKTVFPVTGDCGHEFEASAVGITEKTDLVCPTCGAIDHLTKAQVRDVQAKFATALGRLATPEFASADKG